MNNLFSEMAADVSSAPAEDGLTRIAELATRQQEYEARVKQLQYDLEQANKDLRQVSEIDLPDALLECGVSEFKLTNGSKITVKKVYRGSISELKQEDCFGWLKEHGHDDIIKNELKLAFGRGDEEKARKAMEVLSNAGFAATQKKSVHPQTLYAFIREQVESGAAFPLETFSVFIGNKATIK